jgi:hypothetical protein
MSPRAAEMMTRLQNKDRHGAMHLFGQELKQNPALLAGMKEVQKYKDMWVPVSADAIVAKSKGQLNRPMAQAILDNWDSIQPMLKLSLDRGVRRPFVLARLFS